MRLIDADTLVSVLRNRVPKEPTHNNLIVALAVGACIHEIDNANTIDAVPVVRCCECKWHYPEYTGELMCTNCPKGQEETFFCAGGRRRDGQTG